MSWPAGPLGISAAETSLGVHLLSTLYPRHTCLEPALGLICDLCPPTQLQSGLGLTSTACWQPGPPEAPEVLIAQDPVGVGGELPGGMEGPGSSLLPVPTWVPLERWVCQE